MPPQGSPSPTPRPQLDCRASSSQSLSKGAPTAGHLSKSHKGSSTKLHKAHAVGHGRHPNKRVPSYGKGLHKLSKLNPGEVSDAGKHHTRSPSHSSAGSPTSQHAKRNSSQISLPKVGSKVSMKRNASNVSLTKIGNQPKSEKAQAKNNLKKKGTDDAPLKNTVNFSIGDDQDEDWEEASSSQSPHTTRHNSVGLKTPQLEDPPSPDEPPARSPSNLPHSPPQSPPLRPSAFAEHEKENNHQKKSKYSHPLDGDEVSHRLLDRSKPRPDARMSNISATITPNGSTGSPAFSHNHDPNFAKEPSMPADGISRFLTGTGSNSGSETPGSISHLQTTLAFHQKNHPPRPQSPSESPSRAKPDTRRVKSATNLTHPRLTNHDSSSSASPPKSEKSPTLKSPLKPRVSPYESARGADPSAGKSLTQLKLDLQRLSTLHDAPSNTQPTDPFSQQHASVIGVQNLNASGVEIATRTARGHLLSEKEFRNARRFHKGFLIGTTVNAETGDARKKVTSKGRGRGVKTPTVVTPVGSSGDTRGGRSRVRFEIGGGSLGDGGDGEGVEDGDGEGSAGEEMDGMGGLVRRMWSHQVEEGEGG